MNDYPSLHVPGAMAPIPSRPAEVPPLDDELDGQLEDTAGVHAGVDFIRDGIRLIAHTRLTADQTQTILSTIAGADANLLTALGLLVKRLTNPGENPALDTLDAQTAKDVQQLGEQFAYDLAELAPGDKTTEAAALIDGI
ncbi:hypothetical protein ACFWV1_26385 [Streptomyces sp. NPDC058700]|uniref:hypothetical protein n=1 Tax=Streptomyces sp. NPDC058700 TaxID=3346607 RepID=UPI003669FA38